MKITEVPSQFKEAFRDYILYLQVEQNLAELSVEAYSRDLNRYLIWLEEEKKLKDLNGVTLTHVERYLYYLVKIGLSPRSMGRQISSLRSFHGFLEREEWVSENPTALLESPKILNPLPEILDADEIEQMIQSVQGKSPSALRITAILECLYATGMRVSELLSLKVSQVVFELGFVRVFGKGRKERLIPIGEPALLAIKNYLNEGRGHYFKDSKTAADHVFLNNRGKALSRMGVWKLIQEAAKSANIQKRVYPHIFRHSFATHLIEGGADLRAVQDMLGHASIITTEVYTHIDRNYLSEVHRSFHPRG